MLTDRYAFVLACLLLAIWQAKSATVAGKPRSVRRQAAAAASGETASAPAPANASSTPTSAADASFTIDFLLSNWWNNTQYLAASSPNVPFLPNVTFVSQSQNATNSTPLVVGIEVKERRQYQIMTGLGASITDATAIVLQSLRAGYPDAYNEILNLAFNESPEWIDRGGAGMNMIRTPIGSSDFGFTQYSYDDVVDGTPDPELKLFDIEKSPKRWQTIQDILAINPNLIIMGSAWSPPGWMKDANGSLAGGQILEKYEGVYCDYLVKFIQTVGSSKNIPVKYITLMNEPLYTSKDRPTTSMTSDQQARVGLTCRAKLDAAGLTSVKILAYDHNWDSPNYPIEVFDKAKEAFAGVAWHCYGGEPKQQDLFNVAYPGQEVMMTECTRITQYGSETWSNLQRQFNEIITGSIDYQSQAIILWNMALQVDRDGFTIPTIPNQCLNCLAPFLIFDNSTQPNLEGSNLTQIHSAQSAGLASKRSFVDDPFSPSVERRQATGPDPYENAGNVPQELVNVGATNKDDVIPPYRSTYYQTSDFVAMVHLGRAIRPNLNGARWAQRVGVVTTEDAAGNPRLRAQLFRNDLGNGRSRWSLVILQWYTHFDYTFAVREDMTLQIKFRDTVATLVLPPGVFTLQWEADNSSFESEQG